MPSRRLAPLVIVFCALSLARALAPGTTATASRRATAAATTGVAAKPNAVLLGAPGTLLATTRTLPTTTPGGLLAPSGATPLAHGAMLINGATPRAPRASAAATAALQAHMAHELRLAGAQSGAYVYDMSTAQTLFSERALQRRAPASVEKLYTATTALERMGPSAQLETQVLGVGKLAPGGVWEGNLYLHGGGDPMFGTASFIHSHYGGVGSAVSTLATQLEHTDGIHRVTGKVEGDESYFDSLRGEPSSGYRLDPFLEGDLSAVAFNRGETGSERGSHAPAAFAARKLRAALRAAGVAIPGGGGAASTPAGAVRLAGVLSPTIAQLLGLTLPPSDNFFAETLLKDLGARFGGAGSVAPLTGATAPVTSGTPASSGVAPANAEGTTGGAGDNEPTTGSTSPAIGSPAPATASPAPITGTTAAGAAVVRATLAELGVHPQVVDGSGLSRQDATSPYEVVTLLNGLAHTELGTILRADLAVAGRTGTLADRMRGTAAAGRCEGKTGTLIAVSNLAGYCTAANGDELAFAFFNDGISIEAAHTLQDNMAITLADY